MRHELIKWEKETGYKSKFVAGKIGVSESAWSKIKQGKQNLTIEQAIRLKNAFGIDGTLLLNKGETWKNTQKQSRH